ncbi:MULTISPECIES: hypothetical protein [unclassified Spirosoma]|uniref:hypothetical protein n=1 Tax=unclassified Spirosoma TaxID=2621999 RepID=UPI000963A7B5|nr:MULTISPECIES: hypothetical protein [unclassified Spirosoma]MBN8821575.1 hypothetical protein [Spirosoma sp.]OJW78347.1 MAG: hypothetical protein BGO59_30540 [Spirosoma sp. 48-14]
MNTKSPLLFLVAAMSVLACSKSNSSPEPDLTSQIAGTYTLAKLTQKEGGAILTATGSATITAVDQSTAKIRQFMTIKNVSSLLSIIDYTYTYKVAQTGNSLTIQQEYDINKTISVGDITGSKLTTTDLVVPGATPLVSMIAEYSK